MFIMKGEQLLAWNNWYKNVMQWNKKHFLFFACIFVQTDSSKKDQYSPPFSQTRDTGEQDCNIPSWSQCCFKESYSAFKNHTFQVKSKTTKTFNKAGHYSSFFSIFVQAF